MEISSNDESSQTVVGGNDVITTNDGELACLRVPAKEEFSVANYRKSIGLTQVQFAETYDISLGTLRKWERKNSPDPVFGNSFQRILFDWLKGWITKAHT